MRHKWVNLILLALVAGEFVTGAFGLMSGNARNEIVLQAHSVLGYSIIAPSSLGKRHWLCIRSNGRPEEDHGTSQSSFRCSF